MSFSAVLVVLMIWVEGSWVATYHYTDMDACEASEIYINMHTAKGTKARCVPRGRIA